MLKIDLAGFGKAVAARPHLPILLLAYCVVFGWFLSASDFLPYVMDANETFSSLTHAYNLFHFDFWQSFGLTDEAASTDPAAHPVLHTHQGNFPRIFSFAVYVLGARSIESQVVVTTFTVGITGVGFAYCFFRRETGPAFALIAGLVLTTDYVLIAQWQVVTYRVWHMFFLFASLLCCQGLGGPRRKMWSVITFVNYVCLFYFEFVFVAFVAILCGLYTAWLYRKRWHTIVTSWLVQLAGAITGLSILAIQLIAYMGWHDFLEDAYLTFLARNLATDSTSFEAMLREFYQSRNIAFFYNLGTSSDFGGFWTFWQSLFAFTFQVHTPFLSLFALISVTGWGIAAAADKRANGAPRPNRRILAATLLTLPVYLFLLALLRDDALLGTTPSGLHLSPHWVLVFSAMTLIASVLISSSLVSGRLLWSGTPASISRIVGCGVFLVAAATFITFQGRLYDQSYKDLWLNVLSPANRWPPVFVILLTTTLSLAAIIKGRRRLLGGGGDTLVCLYPFFICGFIAYAGVYLLSPGYVHTGYLTRYAPLPAFLIDTVLAVAFYFVFAAACTAARRWNLSRSIAVSGSFVRRQALGGILILAVSASLGTYFTVYWGGLQLQYVRLLPPDHFGFLKTLRETPFKGASFAANNYALPITRMTGNWAYFDPKMAEGKVTLSPDGYSPQRDLTYLWMADGRTSDRYLKPDYFLCIITQNISTVLADLRSKDGRPPWCSLAGIVQRARSPYQKFLKHRVVATASDSGDKWTLLKLDWDYPPFLRPTADADNADHIALNVSQSSVGTVVDIDYTYAHQEKRPESRSAVRLFKSDYRTDFCPDDETRWKLVSEQHSSRRLVIPSGSDRFYRVSVTPATATKHGPAYFSRAFTVNGVNKCP
jgi:hypothetical protein